eukprot:TRINITY_DN4685_c0_g2_i3.p1 TRINITY_DN4685_c0_g2~~TRINITY_DN4685_c0_g2_i3.p1  ORF type:complete len:657 (-),score=47.77 TRINITY_DN4685_c0_g2_i3:369-2339(-)
MKKRKNKRKEKNRSKEPSSTTNNYSPITCFSTMFSNNIPAYVLKDLIPHLTLQDVIRCRTVSKGWYNELKSVTRQLTSPQKPVVLFVQVPTLTPPQISTPYCLQVISPCPSSFLTNTNYCEELHLELKVQVVNQDNDVGQTQTTTHLTTFSRFLEVLQTAKRITLFWTHKILTDASSNDQTNTEESTSLSAHILNSVIQRIRSQASSPIINIILTLPFVCQPFTLTSRQASSNSKSVSNGRSLVSESLTIQLFHGLVRNLDREVLGMVEEVQWDGMPLGWWGDTLQSVFPNLVSVCVQNATGSAVNSILGSVWNLKRLRLYGGHRLGQVLRDVACAQGSKNLQELRIRFCNGDTAIPGLMRASVVENISFSKLNQLELIIDKGLWYEDVMCLNSTLPSLTEFSLGIVGIDHSSQILGVLEAVSDNHSAMLNLLSLSFKLDYYLDPEDFDSKMLIGLTKCTKLSQLKFGIESVQQLSIDLKPIVAFGKQLRKLEILGSRLRIPWIQYLFVFDIPLETFHLQSEQLWTFLNNETCNLFYVNRNVRQDSRTMVGSINVDVRQSWKVVIALVFQMFIRCKWPHIKGFVMDNDTRTLWRVCMQQLVAKIVSSSSNQVEQLIKSSQNVFITKDQSIEGFVGRQEVISKKRIIVQFLKFLSST